MSKSILILSLSAVIASVLLPRISRGEGESTSHELNVNGVIRRYEVYKPVIPGAGPPPLMIVLHGGLGNAESIKKTTGMNDIADHGKFVVAYPDGTGGRFRGMRNRRTWNAGRCCGQAVRKNADDVLFITNLIEDLRREFSVDTRRVYVTGMSNGAMMAYRLACEIPEKIAAIMPVSGTLAVGNCDNAKDVAVLHIHGDRDEHVPFSGGKGDKSRSGVNHRSVPDTMKAITQSRNCLGPEETVLEGDIRQISYRSLDGAPVQLLVIKGGGHVWPGGHGRNGVPSSGNRVFASQKIWDFARQFHKRFE